MKILTFSLGELRTNTYFCSDQEGNCVVIDPGMDGRGIYEKLLEKNLNPSYILLTHGHFDHSQGVKYLAEQTGARILIHEEDRRMLTEPQTSAANFYYHGNLDSYPRVAPDRLLRDGDEITLGSLSFTVLHTPGHTPGSVCFLCKDVIFCGDTVFAYGFGRYDLWGGDRARLAKSLERIARLEGDYKLCPGHGNTVTLFRIRERIAEDAKSLAQA